MGVWLDLTSEQRHLWLRRHGRQKMALVLERVSDVTDYVILASFLKLKTSPRHNTSDRHDSRTVVGFLKGITRARLFLDVINVCGVCSINTHLHVPHPSMNEPCMHTYDRLPGLTGPRVDQNRWKPILVPLWRVSSACGRLRHHFFPLRLMVSGGPSHVSVCLVIFMLLLHSTYYDEELTVNNPAHHRFFPYYSNIFQYRKTRMKKLLFMDVWHNCYVTVKLPVT